MKKFYYISQDGNHTSEEFKEKTFSEHSAVEWISVRFKNPKNKHNKYIIKSIYEKLKG
jgi:hypothetical protein